MRAAPTALIKPRAAAAPAASFTPAERLRVGVLLLAAVVTIGLVIYSLVLAVGWVNRPFLGVMLTHQISVNGGQPSGDEGWPGLSAGLLRGDRILQINSTEITNQDALDEAMRAFAGSERQYITVIFERPAPGGVIPMMAVEETENATLVNCPASDIDMQREVALCRVTYTQAPFPTRDLIAFFITPFVSGVAVLVIGLLLLALRGRQPEAFLPIIGCFLLTLFMTGIFDGSTTHETGVMWLSACVILGGILVTVGMTFPNTVPFVYRMPFLRFLPLALSAVLLVLVLGQFYSLDHNSVSSSAVTASVAVIMGNAIMAALMFFYQRPRATTSIQRDQANTLFIGSALAMAPALVWLVNLMARTFTDISPIQFSIEATTPFFIPPAVSAAYALLQYRPGDSDRTVSRSITYTIMLLALIGGYFLLVLGSGMFVQPRLPSNNPLLIAVTIFILAVMFLPVRTYLQQRIDNIYFRKRRNYQDQLETFGRKLSSLLDYKTIMTETRDLLQKTIQPSSSLIFLYDPQQEHYAAYGDPKPETDIIFTPGSGVVELLKNSNTTIFLEPGRAWPLELKSDRARLNILKVMVIAGMHGSERLNGFICLAPPADGSVYSYEELRFINNLVSQVAVTIERAQALSSMERRVRQLDVLSRVGQAVNFTIEMDDLLELISAQTNQLIPSPYFYIALCEPLLNEMYFAFFLEDDERERQKENKRWKMGRDLFSEVLKSSQPRLVDDYARVMEKNNYEYHFESRSIRAWLGVPLIAGSRTLGVLAVGESAPGKTFTQEQLRTFTDIAALAASAIDRARLFTETNTRARQLSVLNDISRQLVAAEADIEMLLNLITSAAVDILNAQAGSLLLTVNDGSGDLEFKASVGGTGDQLLGQKLRAGYGFVGKVAASGEPAISNDTSSDQRFDGDVSEFRTNSIIAVPLIGKDRVVGVLEVLNKKDGSPFINEDLSLLTTFAGQAAIALENAQLLETRDVQLTRRVQELENLELIDKELNRTLDIQKVAQITIRWAIANSGAVAGMLGILTEDKSYLRVIANYGYKDDLIQRNLGENGEWPLERGIIKRVMRTRRPDLAPDVSIDPDYVELLPRSISQITVPMLSGDEINAVLVLETNREPRFNLLDLDFVQRLAEHASIAIANAQLYAELTRANASKSEFMAFAAHEMKTPLTSVKGYADLLRAGGFGSVSEQQATMLNTIRTNADRMQTIIDDLRDYAKIQAGQPMVVSRSPIRFHNVVMETLRSLQHMISEKKQTVEINVAEDLPLVSGDESRLIQVMTNFLSNAYKYSPPEASITITAKVKEIFRDERGNNIGPLMLIAIKDTGIGMDEDDLRKLFKVAYFRSDRREAQDQPGTGLGMMITQNLIKQHDGQVWVESEIGKGTTFYFTLPLAPVALPQSKQEVETEPASD
ncbi:MAG: GAF domain-containing protein [bacterium]|nr:GAF domain-containing protein [bacterium]